MSHSASCRALIALLAAVSGTAIAQPVTVSSPLTINPGDTTILGVPLATAQITVQGTTLTVNGRHSIASLSLVRNGAAAAVLNHAPAQTYTYAPEDVVYGMHLIVTGDVQIQGSTGGVASAINVSGRGFAGGTGPGAGQASTDGGFGGTGGGYGGDGTSSGVFAGGQGYGSITAPSDLGSGGGAYGGNVGGAGGGCVRLDVGGTLTVDGSIVASGIAGATTAGFGSGGSIFISATSFAGAGTLSANGGGASSAWGGGGGGRIAVDAAASTFAGAMNAAGGVVGNGTPTKGGAGTIYYKPSSIAQASFTLDNGTGALGAPTRIETNLDGLSLTISDGANVISSVEQSLLTQISITGSSRLQLTGAGNFVSGNLFMGLGTTLAGSLGSPLGLEVGGDFTVTAGSTVSVSGLGNAAGSGAGQPSTTGATGGTGGGHGGTGASSGPFAGGAPYGSLTQPSDMGSGGGAYVSTPGGRGGGALRLEVGGVFTMSGLIAADGAAGSSAAGCGSGGSIWITTDSLAGNGTFRANGGEGTNWGGGGGGRIALYYDTSTFTGSLVARGGVTNNSSPTRGGAGTVFIKPNAAAFGSLTVDNATTTISAPTPITENLSFSSVTLRNGARVHMTVPQTITGSVTATGSTRLEMSGTNTIAGDLVLGPSTGNTLAHAAQQPLDLHVMGNVSIASGCAINLNGLGYPGGAGPGAGQSSTTSSTGAAGGGHAGFGASSGAFAGGSPYGSLLLPLDMGSGGGLFVGNPAGSGGGALRLTVDGTLTNNGTISANGTGLSNSSGAGSGGSILIFAPTLSGAGLIACNGGSNAASSWGGGSGGRIAIYADTSSYTGTFATEGGISSSSIEDRGAVGTRITKQPVDAYPELVVATTAAPSVAATILSEPLTFKSVRVSDAARLRSTSPQSIVGPLSVLSNARLEIFGDWSVSGDVLVSGTGSRIQHARLTPASLTVLGNMTIAAGSLFDAAGLGHPSPDGPGAGQSSTTGSTGGAGGGYGGRGANAGIFLGGQPYGDPLRPTDFGSGGGKFLSSFGGSGGGLVRLSVSQILTVDGTITANGTASSNSSGSGSGGSVYINAGQLAGTGLITANGGNPGNNVWGAGGGGRIAISTCNNTLPSANVRANPGTGGSNAAVAGTIHYDTSGVVVTQQPVGGRGSSGSFLQMNVVASGTSALTYQWRRELSPGNYQPLTEGQDNVFYNVDSDTLFVLSLDCTIGGNYDCLICDTCGCFPSNPALIEVDPVGDYNLDGGVDGSDIDAFFLDWEAGEGRADVNADGGVDGADVSAFFFSWERGC